MPDHQLSEAFVEHIEKMIADLRAELIPCQDGTSRAGSRQQGGEWADITPYRIGQIAREIKALEMSRERLCRTAFR
jgi:hypothetical protein